MALSYYELVVFDAGVPVFLAQAECASVLIQLQQHILNHFLEGALDFPAVDVVEVEESAAALNFLEFVREKLQVLANLFLLYTLSLFEEEVDDEDYWKRMLARDSGVRIELLFPLNGTTLGLSLQIITCCRRRDRCF